MAIMWNDQQRHAIEGRKGTMLVSAAAGSGKTAVLVERVIQRLCDKSDPCSIEELLIVTFTRAAAAQMKEKISDALLKKINEEPDNKELRKCRFMLPYSNIGTIDSFCINLVRDNFYKLNINPDFNILDEGKKAILEETALMTVIQRYHQEKQDEFVYLNNLINNNKDDSEVKELISDLRKQSIAYAFPEEWLKNLYKEYTLDIPVHETRWGKILIEKAVNYIDDTVNKINYCIKKLESEPEVSLKYKPVFEEDLEKFKKLKDTVLYEKWDRIYEQAASCEFATRVNVGKNKSPLSEFCRITREYSRKSDGGYILKKFTDFLITEEEFNNTRVEIAPAIKTLTEAVLEYNKELRELKDNDNSYSFEDTLHFTLELLVESENGEPVRTEFAKQLSSYYKEILVDEYQDVSKAQDIIFWALSKEDTNRFMVGDVKQSIYSFRQAMPDVFINLRKSMTEYDGVHYPASEALTCNYRSRKGVTDAVNFIFRQMMSESTGGVDYNKIEALNPQAKYPESDTNDVMVCLIETDNGVQAQAEYITDYIKSAIENKMQITAKDGTFKDAEYSDFCILYRSSKVCRKYSEVFEEAGVPLDVDTDDSFLNSPEISFVSSLLRIIDNPHNDIPLTAVLMSPAYGFTPDEMSQLRIDNRKGSIYKCLVKSAKSGNKKSENFLLNLEKLRRLSSTLPAGEFTAKLIDEVGYRAIVSAMKNGEMRIANLNAFINLANGYEATGIKGISAFVRFLDKLDEKTVRSGAEKSDSANSVKMMTIHKSKGLEFPVVFLVNTEKEYNLMDLRSNAIISKNCGIAIKTIEDNTRYETIPHLAAKVDKLNESISEELRVLYVALTRPKEKLIILASDKDWGKTLKKYAVNVTKGNNPSSVTISGIKKYSELILTALLKHPDAHKLRELAEIDADIHENCDSQIDFEIIKPAEKEEQTAEISKAEYYSDKEMLKEITDRLSYVYPFKALNGVVGKQIASKLDNSKSDDKYFASSKPSFRSKTGLTSAQKGIATHRFMQYCEFESAEKDVRAELNRLVSEDMLTQQEADAVDAEAIGRFFETDIAKRLIKADKQYREYPFTSSLPIYELYPEITKEEAGDEIILIEGVVDCAFEENGKLIIIDFKTDRAKNAEELIENYSSQLGTYQKCMSKVLGMKVEENIIYSFHLNKEIKL